jgi:hypothetical protein
LVVSEEAKEEAEEEKLTKFEKL